ncbi:MAG: YceI family protein [Pseudomonadota bacterium]|jgi:polyisoprenoid-binding protein YceI
MRRSIALLALVLGLARAAGAEDAPVRWRFDPVHCQVLFFADHLGFSRQMGRFTGVTGSIDFDPDDWTAGRVEATIDVDSLWLGDAAWEKKMRSDDFFDAGRFPAARFTSQRIEPTSESTARVHGLLELRGVARPVVLEVTRNRVGRNTFNLKQTAGFSARTTLSRRAFGISRLPAAIADDVEIVLEIEAIRE